MTLSTKLVRVEPLHHGGHAHDESTTLSRGLLYPFIILVLRTTNVGEAYVAYAFR